MRGAVRQTKGSEVAKSHKCERSKPGEKLVKTWVNGAEDVTAVELGCGEEVERSSEESDPGGAADRVEKEEVRIDAGMEEGVEEPEEERNAEDDAVLVGIGVGDGGDEAGMKDAVEEGGDGKDEADQWTGSANVEEGTGGANGGAHEDEGAEGTDEGWKGNEEGIAGANVMVAAGEVMTEFVGEKDR
jgi:hypothetical protein